MQGFNFTDDVRRVLALARDEATRWNHAYVGTEHVLLAYTLPEHAAATRLLDAIGASANQVRASVEQIVRRGPPGAPIPDQLPYTNRAKKTLELAMVEARDMGHSFVGIEHLLLGVLREEEGIGAQVLTDYGVSAESIRAALLQRHPAPAAVNLDWERRANAPPTHFYRLRFHRWGVVALSLLWATAWTIIRRDTLSAEAVTTLLIIAVPPLLLWFFIRPFRQ